MTFSRLRPSPEEQSGVAMIEFALLLTFLATLIFGLIDFGNTLSDYQDLKQGVREAAREATNHPEQFSSSAAFANFIVSRTGLSSSRLSITWSPSGTLSNGSTFQVCVNYATQSITGMGGPFLPSTLRSHVQMRMEPFPSSTFPAPAATPPVVRSLSPCS